MAQRYLDSLEVSANTREEYRKTLTKYWMPRFALRAIDTIQPSELRAVVNGIPWSSAKTRNNSLIPLRGVFELASDDDLIDKNPAGKIKNIKHQKPPVDPFEQAEAEKIITHLYSSHIGFGQIYGAYCEFAFFSGMRTSEMLALTWDDIDWHNGIARVSKAKSKGRLNNQTKTANSRDVILNARSLHALQIMKPLTYLNGGMVFIAPQTREPWTRDNGPRKIFTATLRRLGIRHRPAYNTRHTYATMMLMSGVNPVFVAQQLGHSVVMTLTIYSRWLSGKQDKIEMGKLDLVVPERAKNATGPYGPVE